MNEKCEFCGGKVESLTSLGSRFCPDCAAKYSEFLCEVCGIRAVRGQWVSFARNVCSRCQMEKNLEGVPPQKLHLIKHELENGSTIIAIKTARELLNLSISDAMEVVGILRNKAR